MLRIKFLLVFLIDYTSCNSYTFVPGSFTFQDGRDECLSRGMDLAIITDIDMHNEVHNLLAPEIGGGLSRVWIGMVWNKAPLDHFSWINNEELGPWTNWDSSEPNCMEGTEPLPCPPGSYDQNCVRIQYEPNSWVWKTHGCYNTYPILCQSLSTITTSFTTDAQTAIVSSTTDAQTTTVSSTTDAQTTIVSSTTDAQTTIVTSTTDAQTTNVSSTTDAQTTIVPSTTDAQTTIVPSTTDAQTTTVSSTTDAQTTIVSSTTDAQTTIVTSTTDAQTTNVSSTTDAQTTIVSSTTDAQTTIVPSTTDAQTTTVSSTTDAQTTIVSSTTDAQTTIVTSTTDAQTTIVTSTTDAQTTNVSSTTDLLTTTDTTFKETSSKVTKIPSSTSPSYLVSESAATTVSSKTNLTTTTEPTEPPMITTTKQETSFEPSTEYIPVQCTTLGTFFINSTQVCSCQLLSNRTNLPEESWNFKIDKRLHPTAYICI